MIIEVFLGGVQRQAESALHGFRIFMALLVEIQSLLAFVSHYAHVAYEVALNLGTREMCNYVCNEYNLL